MITSFCTLTASRGRARRYVASPTTYVPSPTITADAEMAAGISETTTDT